MNRFRIAAGLSPGDETRHVEVEMSRAGSILRKYLFLVLIVGTLTFDPVFLKAGNDESIYEKIELYQNVIDKVSSRYVTDMGAGDLIIRSIEGMIGTLDPYSQLLDPDDYNDLKVDTKGRFGGIGIELGLRNNILTVIAPIEGTPAHALGLQGGDQIIRIEGNPTKGWSTLDAVKLLRGPKGTDVSITIQREGLGEPFDITITRDIIKVKSVPYYFLVDSSTGYIRLSTFSESSGDEVRKAVDDLKSQGMDALILDLRYNPGGLLNQAVEVSEVFMERGEMIVFTSGRDHGQDREYLASRDGLTHRMPLIVLINKYSASASEIVAGALQDHDRALILGETSFGKGSVQTLFDLGSDYALRLTTAYYYTPSGRSIHKAEETELAVINGHSLNGEAGNEAEKGGYYTDSGREVSGGGGIMPDVFVRSPELTSAAQEMLKKPIFFNFSVKYKSHNPDLPEDFEITEDIKNEFFEYMTGEGIEVSKEDFFSEKEFVEMRLEFELNRAYWGEGVAKKKGFDRDIEAQKALEIIDKGKTLVGLFEVASAIEEGDPGL
jgi:carboxyl-terminal processing protease